MNPAPRLDAPRQSLLHLGEEWLLGLLLFGDYLALSASRLLTGSSGNWLLFVAAVQPLAILAMVATGRGRGRGRWPRLPIVAWLGLVGIGLAHGGVRWWNGGYATDYAVQKSAAVVLLLGPALVLGILIGRRGAVPGARAAPWLFAPLLVAVGAALAIDPRLLTIEHFADPPVFLGWFVLPTHQALAFCLAKAALLWFAPVVARTAAAGRGKWLLGVVGALIGLVLLTGARSYAVALLAALALQTLLARHRLGLLIAGAAIAALLFQKHASDLVQDRFDPSAVLESIAYRERQQAWELAVLQFAEQPCFGVGPGGFAEGYGGYGRIYPHNLPLEIASEFGCAGLLFLCLLLVAVALPSLRVVLACRAQRRPVPPQLAFALGLFVFTFVGAMAVGDLIRNSTVFLAAGMAAAAAATARSAGAAAGVPQRGRPAARSAA